MRRLLYVLLPLLLLAGWAQDDVLRRLYEGGVTYEEFLEEAERRKAMWHANTEKATPPPQLVERALAVGGTWRLLAVAVDGCSDSANVIPYLASLAAAVENLDLRIINSAVGRTLMEAHPTPDGRAATPTVILLDSAFDDAGAFIERPAPLQEWAIAHRDSLDSDAFLQAKFAWYDEDLGETTMEEVVALMEAASPRDPN